MAADDNASMGKVASQHVGSQSQKAEDCAGKNVHKFMSDFSFFLPPPPLEIMAHPLMLQPLVASESKCYAYNRFGCAAGGSGQSAKNEETEKSEASHWAKNEITPVIVPSQVELVLRPMAMKLAPLEEKIPKVERELPEMAPMENEGRAKEVAATLIPVRLEMASAGATPSTGKVEDHGPSGV